MKKKTSFLALALIVVVTASLFVGCESTSEDFSSTAGQTAQITSSDQSDSTASMTESAPASKDNTASSQSDSTASMTKSKPAAQGSTQANSQSTSSADTAGLSSDLSQYLMDSQQLQQNFNNYVNANKQNANNAQAPAAAKTGQSSAYYASLVQQYQTLVDNDEEHLAFDQQQYDSAVNGEGGLVTATQESLAAGKQTLENDEQTLATYKALEQQAENQGR